MLVRQLRQLGVSSDVLNAAGLVSIFGSIAVWARAKRGDAAHGERFGIFVGLWAPTFFVLASELAIVEQEDRPRRRR